MVETEGPTRCFLGWRAASAWWFVVDGRGQAVDEAGPKSRFVSRRLRFLELEGSGGKPGDAVMEPAISCRTLGL